VPDSPVSDQSLFDTASCSKSFTSAAIALLVEDDENYPNIHWKAKISDILPNDFILADDYFTKNITIEDILSHRTGLPRHDDSPLSINSPTPDSPQSVTRNLRNLAISRGLREEFQYSNLMYTVACHLVQTVTGESFGEFLRRRIWDPLGMDHTYFDVPGVEARSRTDNISKPYRWCETSSSFVELQWLVQPEGHGSGSIFSCAADYAKWIRCMISDSPPFSKESHEEFAKPRIGVAPKQDEERRKRGFSHQLYALGWESETYRGHTVIGHDGGMPGFCSLMRYMPDFNWGFVVLGNSNGAGELAGTLFWTMVDDLLEVPKTDRTDWGDVFQKELEGDDEEKSDDSFLVPTEPFLDVLPSDRYTGKYFNAGYHELSFEIRDEKLFADCSDRSFPFTLTLRHLSGQSFVADLYDLADAEVTTKMKAVFVVDGNKVRRLGISFIEELQDELVWFNKRV
jgi:CubicO group peptidase (beta-lactamase class C family)